MTISELEKLPFNKEIEFKGKYNSLYNNKIRLESRGLGFMVIEKKNNVLFFKKLTEKPNKEINQKIKKPSKDKYITILKERFSKGEYKIKHNIDWSKSTKELVEQTGLTKQRISQLRIITGNQRIGFCKYSTKKEEIKNILLNYSIIDGFYFIPIFEREMFINNVMRILNKEVKTYKITYLKYTLKRLGFNIRFENFNLKNYINFKLPNKVLNYVWGKNHIHTIRYNYNMKESIFTMHFIDIRPGIKSLKQQINILCGIDENFKKMYHEEIKKVKDLKNKNLI